jgi:CubicO group peptidase (beta-lactamase class C family)
MVINESRNLQAAADLDLRPWVRDEAGPGVIAAILAGGQVTSWASRGRVTLGDQAERLTPRTVFYVASVSKQFTAACVMACEADRGIEIDASIRRYLPELPALFESITIRHLLHHLGGLPHGGAGGLTAAPKADGDWRDGLGLWDLIGLLAKEPALLSPPGERYAYSNCGYWLLAAAVERASGESFAAYARQRLFEPLGMGDSRFRDAPDAPQPGLAPAHLRKGDGYAPVFTRFHGVGDGGLLTTVQDLAKWDVFWSGGSRLGPDLPPRMLQQGRRNDGAELVYARGVSVRRHRGVPIISHGGSFLGYQSKLVRFPDQNFSICALANADDIDTDALCIALADSALSDFIDEREPSWAETFREDGLTV